MGSSGVASLEDLLRILVGNQIIWAINSVCHTHGDRTFETRDDSANNWLLAIPAFGEGWHNNHHAFPWSARFGLSWWQLDVGWWAIRCFNLVGLASQPKCPTPTQILGMARNVGQSDSSPPPEDTRTNHVVDSVILPH